MTAPRPKPLTEEFLTALEGMTELLEAVDGYRAKCMEHGYPEAVAHRMAADFHRFMLESIINNAKAGR